MVPRQTVASEIAARMFGKPTVFDTQRGRKARLWTHGESIVATFEGYFAVANREFSLSVGCVLLRSGTQSALPSTTQNVRKAPMLWTCFVALVFFWCVGLLTSSMNGFIHVLPVLAAVVAVVGTLQRRLI